MSNFEMIFRVFIAKLTPIVTKSANGRHRKV